MRRLRRLIGRALVRLIDDAEPVLGGDLDVNDKEITDSSGNGVRVADPMVLGGVASSPEFGSSDFEIIKNTYAIMRQLALNDTPGNGAEIYLQRARGTLGTESEPQDDDYLGIVFAAGYDGGAWGSSASFAVQADGNHGIGSTPGKITLNTTPNGSTSLYNRLRIGREGNIRQYKGRRITGDISPSQITGNQDDYNPTGLDTASVLRLDSDGDYNITGLTAQDDGTLLYVFNVGSNILTLTNEDASSTAANRFALADDLVLNPNEGAILWYDTTSDRWRAAATAATAPPP